MSHNHRDVTPLLYKIRAFLRGREHQNAHRFADCIAARVQPPPEIPGGPYHKTSKIYYYSRDGRREVEPPFVIAAAKQITSGTEGTTQLRVTTPNKVYLA